jgi:hypothetical protein
MTMSADTVSADAVHVEIKKQTNSPFDKELLKSYRRLREDYLWIFSNEGKLRITYPDSYIAVENKSVKFANGSLEVMLTKIKESGGQVEDFVIEYMGTRRVNLLF